MQITDEHGWLQIVYGTLLTFLGGAWMYLQRQISRLRSTADKHTEQIHTNTKDIAVNSAIREEITKRHSEMMTRFDRLEEAIKVGLERRDNELKAGLSKMDDKLSAAESAVHTRINDLWKAKGGAT